MTMLRWEGDKVFGKYMTFTRIRNSPSGKTMVWDVEGLHGHIGIVKWFFRWRQYSFFPDLGTVYSHNCLYELGEFCRDLRNGRQNKL